MSKRILSLSLQLGVCCCILGACASRTVAPAPQPDAPLQLRWEVEKEENVYGYMVLRADKETGPFLRLTEQLILRAPKSESTGRYSFVDRNSETGKVYFYRLLAVGTNGAKVPLGGVVRRDAR